MLSLRKVCGLIVPPTDFEIKIGNYPLSRPFYAYAMRDGIAPFARDFLEWTKTDTAQTSVGLAGFAGAALHRMRMQDLGVMLIHNIAVEPDFNTAQFKEMTAQLREADRLSISFRFTSGSSTLDEDSVSNIRDMAARLRNRQFDGMEVLLVGFADSVGDSARNTLLASRRANAVRSILAREFDTETLSRFKLTALSFGEQLPLDCNDTPQGRANNRRVEVWLRLSGSGV